MYSIMFRYSKSGTQSRLEVQPSNTSVSIKSQNHFPNNSFQTTVLSIETVKFVVRMRFGTAAKCRLQLLQNFIFRPKCISHKMCIWGKPVALTVHKSICTIACLSVYPSVCPSLSIRTKQPLLPITQQFLSNHYYLRIIN